MLPLPECVAAAHSTLWLLDAWEHWLSFSSEAQPVTSGKDLARGGLNAGLEAPHCKTWLNCISKAIGFVMPAVGVMPGVGEQPIMVSVCGQPIMFIINCLLFLRITML